MNLRELRPGQSGTVIAVGGAGALRQHLLDMGVIPGMELTVVKYAPMGDPVEIMVSGYELTLRLADAEKITVDRVHSAAAAASEGGEYEKDRPHPGFGEEDEVNYNHDHVDVVVNPGKLVFALVGNQNCGKTTLFNRLTGSNQHVGNFPGVTVDAKSGEIIDHPEATVVDLPGIYSLSPYTSEEVVSRRFILEHHPSAIINIVDATNIERNLCLTVQLLELGVPVILALNMMDEVTRNGGAIRINELEHQLKIPVVPISAAKNEGIGELIDHALHIARYGEKPGRQDFCERDDHGGAVHRAVHGIMSLVEDHAEAAQLPLRFAAGKLIEGDSLVREALKLDENEQDAVEHIVAQMESERGLDRSAAMADMRFAFIRKLCALTVRRPRESREHRRSREIDKLLTGRFTAIPVFAGIMALVFYLTFGVIGAFLQDLIAAGLSYLQDLTDALLTKYGVAKAVHSLIINAVFSGVGTVISFVPIIVVLYFFLSLLEDSGYMARVAFVMDRLLRRLGLSGRSIVPLLIGFGCSVPAVMSVRTLPSERDRRMTMMLIPFMSCGAKMPIYAFITYAFFGRSAAPVMTGLYFLGIAMAVLVALFTKNTLFRGEAVPFVMELPNYRIPSLKSVTLLMWEKARDFIERAFTVIFAGTVIVWFLESFDFGLNLVASSEQSMLADLAGAAAPLFAPLGLGDWRLVTALLSGFLAKESVVSTLTVVCGSLGALQAALPQLGALTFLVFCLLYTPCLATITTVRHEAGLKAALVMIIFQCAVAWVVAYAVRLAASALGM